MFATRNQRGTAWVMLVWAIAFSALVYARMQKDERAQKNMPKYGDRSPVKTPANP
jgi:hypothetical protein